MKQIKSFRISPDNQTQLAIWCKDLERSEGYIINKALQEFRTGFDCEYCNDTGLDAGGEACKACWKKSPVSKKQVLELLETLDPKYIYKK